MATGHAALDALLPGGGWPRGALVELMLQEEGIGELSLVLPALAALSREERWIALIAPPHIPYAPALAAAGLELSRLLVVRTANTADTLWAMEEALRSGACAAVLAWPAAISERAQRRLQLAAEEGGEYGDLVHPRPPGGQRLLCHPAPGAGPGPGCGLEIRFVKRRGGGAMAPLVLDLPHALARPAFSRPGAAGLRAVSLTPGPLRSAARASGRPSWRSTRLPGIRGSGRAWR